MPLPASIEADEYSRWGGDDVDDDLDVAPVEASPADPARIVLTAGDEAAGDRLDKWLATRLTAYSRARIQRWIGAGHVRIDGRAAGVRDPVWKDDVVEVDPQASDDENAFAPEPVALDIVYQDDALIVLNKRAGLVVHPAAGNWSGTVLNGLLHHDPSLASVPRAGIVHRLDKDTSGLMVVARTLVAQTDLVRQLQARTVGRTYVAIAHGVVPRHGRVAWPIGRDPRDRTRMTAFRPHAGDAASPAGAKPAATRYRTLATVEPTGGDAVSFVVCRLETGRTHQIRVHLQALGHPLLGDATYGGRRGPPFARQALHAWRLRLIHPRTGATMAWTAPLPDDLAGLTATLGFDAGTLLDAVTTDDDDD